MRPWIIGTSGFYGLSLPSVGGDTHRDDSVKNNLLIAYWLTRTVCSGIVRFHKQKEKVLSDLSIICLTP